MFILKRTHNCGQLTASDVNKVVILNGWVEGRRDHGNLIFVDVRDRYGRTQVIFSPDRDKDAYNVANTLRQEYVIAVKGVVKRRSEGTINKELPTGEVELEAQELEILNEAKTSPFEIVDDVNVSIDLRLKYRYLDLRHRSMQKNFIMRHKITQVIREYFDKCGFIEIETPYMIKNTPGGARNFLIPSRIFNGQFFALSESPQIFKQLFMVSGFDKYFQIARCFRDEDLRADRQLEFTQLDMEMSFVQIEDVMDVVERCIVDVFQKILNVKIAKPFQRIPYDVAMKEYGTDKPDVRFGMKLADISNVVKDCAFKVFGDCIKGGGVVKGIAVPNGEKFS